ncbi:MAG: flagellar hook capping FlgD N-terminal domain-containing protein, partial [Paracoccaceae bacterium]
TFLRMLTVQMQNQDPLNPAEASDFAVQLATFSSVEQQVLTNDLLAGMNGASGQGALGQSGALVGLEARSPAPVRFSGMPIGLHLPDRGDARSAELVVRDAAGKVLQRQALPQGVERVDWAGVDDSGAPFPEGLYRFEVELRTEAEMLGTEPAETYQRIAEIRFTKDGARELVFDGGGAASETEVSALRRPA